MLLPLAIAASAWLVARRMTEMGIRLALPLAIIAAALTLVVAALIAATLPARRAARADPVQTLRRD